MLGNSLTYFNDLPAMVAELAVHGGAVRPTIISVANPDWSLEDHWNDAVSLAAIDDPTVDVVVMQQGPSTLPESGALLLEYAGRIADRVATHGARPGMYVVWPPVGGDIDAGITHYTAAADAGSMAIYPVAHAFRVILASFPYIAIHASDNFHPSPAGSWLAAMVITATIFDQDPMEYPNPDPVHIPLAWEANLRLAARHAIATYARP
jgi:hypothetical protein